MKAFLATLAIIISLLGYIPYFKNTIDKKTKPHVFSWFTWGLASFIAFGIQLTEHGGAGAYVNLAMGIGCFALVVISLRNGTKYITRMDILSLTFALLAIVLWLIVKQPVISILLVILIDVFSFIPTVLKAWKKPHEESITPFAASGIKNALTILAMSTISISTIAYPVYSLLSAILFVVMLMVRRSNNIEIHE